MSPVMVNESHNYYDHQLEKWMPLCRHWGDLIVDGVIVGHGYSCFHKGTKYYSGNDWYCEEHWPKKNGKIFHHGGRLGDCIYSLYAVKELGGGSMIISDFQQGGWGLPEITSLMPLLEYQEYITQARLASFDQLFEGRSPTKKRTDPVWNITHDLHDAEDVRNPQDFPEWKPPHWPGNIHIAKRYAVHFGVHWEPNKPWLTAPQTFEELDVVVHAPHRRLNRVGVMATILNSLQAAGINVMVIGGDDVTEWMGKIDSKIPCHKPKDMLEAADIINSAKCFLGAASSCNVIAEGLGKRRFVEQAQGCDNTHPTDIINDWPVEKIFYEVTKACV